MTSFGLFIFKNNVNVPSKIDKQKNLFFKLVFCWRLVGQWRKRAGSGSESGSGSISQRHGSADPDPHQNVMDPELCVKSMVACREKFGRPGVLRWCSSDVALSTVAFRYSNRSISGQFSRKEKGEVQHHIEGIPQVLGSVSPFHLPTVEPES